MAALAPGLGILPVQSLYKMRDPLKDEVTPDGIEIGIVIGDATLVANAVIGTSVTPDPASQ